MRIVLKSNWGLPGQKHTLHHVKILHENISVRFWGQIPNSVTNAQLDGSFNSRWWCLVKHTHIKIRKLLGFHVVTYLYSYFPQCCMKSKGSLRKYVNHKGEGRATGIHIPWKRDWMALCCRHYFGVWTFYIVLQLSDLCCSAEAAYTADDTDKLFRSQYTIVLLRGPHSLPALCTTTCHFLFLQVTPNFFYIE